MSGTGHTTTSVTSTGDARVDGILGSTGWGDSTLFYSMPTSSSEYGTSYGNGEQDGIFATSSAMTAAVHTYMNAGYGSAANDGFSIEGFTDLNITFTTDPNAHVRVAQTTLDPYDYDTAWGYYPSSGGASGDVWFFDGVYDYSNPVAGNYANLTMMHELGHAMGLQHAHETGSFGAVPSAYDAMEYTVMSYRSYEGAGFGYRNETFGYAQSYMMLDIAALQQMYGADFTTSGGDTVYSWNAAEGITYVDGADAITPGANRIFATIWDGGGIDTYDLSAYVTDLMIDLAPGAFSIFSSAQISSLGSGHSAMGNIYNALQFNDDVRSLIENAIGGNGADDISGNQAANTLSGGRGDDTMFGLGGADTLRGGNGGDLLRGGAKADTLSGNKGADSLYGENGNDILNGGDGSDALYGGNGDDKLSGGNGADTLNGGKAADTLTGGKGADTLTGGNGSDVFVFGNGFGRDEITDFNATNNNEDIDLSAVTAIVDFNDLSNHHMVQSGSDVVITAWSSTITLTNVDLGDLGAGDFIF